MAAENIALTSLRGQNTELHQRITRYEQQFRSMAIINEIADAANSTTDPAIAMANTLKRICQDTNWPAAHAFLVTNIDDEIKLQSSKTWFLSEAERFTDFVSYTEKLVLSPGQGLPGIVYRDKEALWTNAVKSDAKRFALARKVGLQSQFAFPIMIRDEVTAVLEFFSERNLAPDEIVLDVVAQLGMLLGRVFERRRAADERETLNEQLVITSHRAGMAEVASGVLHNVGNILNSITVSCSLIQESLAETSIDGVKKIADLLKEHEGNLADFFSTDSKAEKVIPYLDELARQLHNEHTTVTHELEALLDNIAHVKNAIRRQQHYAKPTTLKEKIQINDLIEDSLKMTNLHSGGHHIKVIREFSDIPESWVDKHDVIQILNNLIGNAKDALYDTPKNPTITVSTKLTTDQKTMEFKITDNGYGIPLSNQENIFQFGFTTKENGHGFGLHTSANTAHNMGGELKFFSYGKNQGATFTLTLPLVLDISAEGRQ